MKTKWKLFVYMTAIFLAGAISGLLLGLSFSKHRFQQPPESGQIFEMLHQKLGPLDLSPEQRRKIQPIIESTGEKLRMIHNETRNKVKEALESARAMIDPELTAKQRLLLEQRRQFRPPPDPAQRHPWPGRPPHLPGPEGPR